MNLPGTAPVLVVQRVSKNYTLWRSAADRWRALLFPHSAGQSFPALKDISFTLHRGECLGIIGPNGAGKSTLLQIVSGIVRPSTGRVRVEGRLAALLELGAGFNAESTGRENVLLAGEIHGLPRAELRRRLPEIEAFAELGPYFDRPVKEYSSGMYVRLAFAAAIHVDPQVLVVDEALAVGDAVFAARCIRRLEALRKAGTAMLLVSHDLGLIKRLADRVIFLLHGEIACQGEPSEVVNRYVAWVHEYEARRTGALPTKALEQGHGNAHSQIERVELLNEAGQAVNAAAWGERLRIRIQVHFRRSCDSPILGFLIRSRNGIDLAGTNTRLAGVELGQVQEGERVQAEFSFECYFAKGEYTLTVASQNADGTSQDWRDDVLSFRVWDEQEADCAIRLPAEIRCTVLTRKQECST